MINTNIAVRQSQSQDEQQSMLRKTKTNRRSNCWVKLHAPIWPLQKTKRCYINLTKSLSILIMKAVQKIKNFNSVKKLRVLSNPYLNPGSLNALWQAIFWWQSLSQVQSWRWCRFVVQWRAFLATKCSKFFAHKWIKTNPIT